MLTARKGLLGWVFAALLAAAAQAQTTAFTYQGQLKNSGAPVTGSYDFTFDLYDAPTGGTLLGSSSQTLPVSAGLFTATLDFGDQFPSAGRWLQISVRPTGGGSYTTLSPRQALTPAPYAIGLELPYVGTTTNPGVAASFFNNDGGALVGSSVNQAGVYGINTGSTLTNSAGVVGTTTVSNGNGVAGIADIGTIAYGVYGEAIDGYALYGYSTNGQGLYATSLNGTGVHGISTGASGVFGESTSDPGVHGVNYDSTSVTAAGVVGESNASNGNGVSGIADSGVFAYGVYGEATGGGWAGYFNGNVTVQGNLAKAGGSFKIDHPLDPANKYLYHSFVESPDMKNVYDGVVTTDASGYATVTLPDWFQSLNRDFRYQLTVIDASDSPDFVQAKIVGPINNNQFTLRTSAPQSTVSWQVTGIRQDPWANAHRIPVEEAKCDLERGLYLHPELYGQSPEAGMQTAKARAAALNPPAALPQPPPGKAPAGSPLPPNPVSSGAAR